LTSGDGESSVEKSNQKNTTPSGGSTGTPSNRWTHKEKNDSCYVGWSTKEWNLQLTDLVMDLTLGPSTTYLQTSLT
jgi:hypothetical protein